MRLHSDQLVHHSRCMNPYEEKEPDKGSDKLLEQYISDCNPLFLHKITFMKGLPLPDDEERQETRTQGSPDWNWNRDMAESWTPRKGGIALWRRTSPLGCGFKIESQGCNGFYSCDVKPVCKSIAFSIWSTKCVHKMSSSNFKAVFIHYCMYKQKKENNILYIFWNALFLLWRFLSHH